MVTILKKQILRPVLGSTRLHHGPEASIAGRRHSGISACADQSAVEVLEARVDLCAIDVVSLQGARRPCFVFRQRRSGLALRVGCSSGKRSIEIRRDSWHGRAWRVRSGGNPGALWRHFKPSRRLFRSSVFRAGDQSASVLVSQSGPQFAAKRLRR